MAEWRRELSWISVACKGTNLTHEGFHTHDLITSQRPHLLIPSQWGLGFQHLNLAGGEGDINITEVNLFTAIMILTLIKIYMWDLKVYPIFKVFQLGLQQTFWAQQLVAKAQR